MNKMTFYNYLPVWGQNAACSLEGLRIEKDRYGKVFIEKTKDYYISGKLLGDELRNFQNDRLKRIITHCFHTVPYYHQLFKKLSLTPNDFKSTEDLQKLPILTKSEIKRQPDLFISSAIPKNQRYIHDTGGTSGAGLSFWTTHAEDSEQWSVWWRYRNALGITRERWCALFGGKVILPLDHKKAPFWRTNYPGRQIFFSSYHINQDTVVVYADELQKRNITWIHGYPTVIAEFARLLLQKNIFLKLDFVTVGSENLTESHKHVIQKAFGVAPFQHYGLTEGVANFSQDIDGNMRVDEDFSCVEFIKTELGNTIIGTTFTNFAMPLLRYDTGDYGELSEHQDGGFRIVKAVSGRSSEYIKKPDGTILTSAAISLIFNSFSEITQGQILQKKDYSLDINLILQSEFDKSRESKLNEKLMERLGPQIRFNVSYVDSLIKTKNGKTKLIITE